MNIRFLEGRRSHSRPALIDTGFNGQLLYQGNFDRALPHRAIGSEFNAETAMGPMRVIQHIATISWFGGELQVELLLQKMPITLGRGSTPLIVGTQLLTGYTLSVDFMEDLVEIRKA